MAQVPLEWLIPSDEMVQDIIDSVRERIQCADAPPADGCRCYPGTNAKVFVLHLLRYTLRSIQQIYKRDGHAADNLTL